jgi:hypothetical protein
MIKLLGKFNAHIVMSFLEFKAEKTIFITASFAVAFRDLALRKI